ncbi:MAG: DNA polymerase III subunit delta, partial [Nitrospirota bacterium]
QGVRGGNCVSPTHEMSFQAFLQEIEKGLPSQVYLLYASDPFLHREAVDAIKRIIPEEERDFNLHIFDLSMSGQENILEKVLEVANTVSFFRRRRFLILENFQKISQRDLKKLESYISNPSPVSVLIMLHEGALKKGLRESLKKLKAIALDIKETDIPYWLKQRAKIKGVEISDEVADYLIGLIGSDLGLLSAEIEKISLLGKQRIDVDDISDIITGGGGYSPFDLVEALGKRDADRVFRTYKALRETTEVYSLVGVLNWQYGRNLPHSPLRVFDLLNSADIDIKSSGRTFPMEYLLIKLLRL